jgi:hypothetical protein
MAAALFVFGAAVQYNDPDPVRWMLIYVAAAAVCIGAVARGNVPGWVAPAVGVIALAWGLFWSDRVPLKEYFQMFDYWEMKSPGAEEARETSGLLIIAAWMGFLSGYARLRSRVRNDAE